MLSGMLKGIARPSAIPTGKRSGFVSMLINRGGFIYMPTHGNTEIAMQPALRILRQILPEYNLVTIRQDHEIYNSFYELNGPLRFPVRKIGTTILHHGPYGQLQGVFVNDRLAVLVDTEAMIHVMDGAVQKPFFGHYQDRNKILDEFAPAAARQLVNIVVYAVTHGTISDYSNYIPASALADGDINSTPKTAPKVSDQL